MLLGEVFKWNVYLVVNNRVKGLMKKMEEKWVDWKEYFCYSCDFVFILFIFIIYLLINFFL